MNRDVIIIGTGASGLMCAMEAGKRGRSVLVLDHEDKIAGKVRISGGGRCNFTNVNADPEDYLSGNPHFPKSALARFTPHDFVAMLEKRGIRYEEKEQGRLFCTGSAEEIVEMLEAECRRAHVQFAMGCTVSEVRKGSGFTVETNRGAHECQSLVVATGGLSMPGLGATNFGYALAKQFGLKVTPLRPALTPLRFSDSDAEAFGALSGVSIHCVATFKGASFKDDLLFTHRGLSGPAVLQISSYWDGSAPISINLLPDVDIHALLVENQRSKMLLATLLGRRLPGRFVKTWCDLYVRSKPLNQYSPKELEAIARALHEWRVQPAAAEGFNKAEVTLGGVDTNELSSKTMEAKKVPGLYFLGEVVDVTGRLGGYNLHWAWASGYAAGQIV